MYLTNVCIITFNKLCRTPPLYTPPPWYDLLTLKMVSESCVTWAISVPISSSS